MSRSIIRVEDGRIRRPGEIALISRHPTYTDELRRNLKRMKLPDLDHLARLVDASNNGGGLVLDDRYSHCFNLIRVVPDCSLQGVSGFPWVTYSGIEYLAEFPGEVRKRDQCIYFGPLQLLQK